MNAKIIVRVDWYPNGLMVPLSITMDDGATVFFDKVLNISAKNCDNNKNRVTYRCLSKNKEFMLLLYDNEWRLI